MVKILMMNECNINLKNPTKKTAENIDNLFILKLDNFFLFLKHL